MRKFRTDCTVTAFYVSVQTAQDDGTRSFPVKFCTKPDSVISYDIALKFAGFFNANLICTRIAKVRCNAVSRNAGLYVIHKEFPGFFYCIPKRFVFRKLHFFVFICNVAYILNRKILAFYCFHILSFIY